MLLGALNWTQTWYRARRARARARIARRFVGLLKSGLAADDEGNRMTARRQFRPKVLVTKIGLDGHDRGSRIVAAAPARRRHGGDLHAAVAGDRRGRQARARGRRRRDRHLLARDRPPDRAEADGRAARRRARPTSRSSSAASFRTRTRTMLLASGVRAGVPSRRPLDEIIAPFDPRRTRARRAQRRARRPEESRHEQAAATPTVPDRDRRRRAGPLGARVRAQIGADRAIAQPSPASRSSRSTRRATGAAPATTTPSAFPASRRTRAASTRRCTAAARGRSGS